MFVRKLRENQCCLSVAQQIREAVRINDKKALYRLIVHHEPDMNLVYEPASSSSTLTLAKVMLIHEQRSLDRCSSCSTETSMDRSSTSSLNLAGTCESQSMDDLDGCSLLHLACSNGDLGLLELLLQYGANVNSTDSKGQTPLHRCIRRGKSSLAKLLLSRGSDLQAINGEGKGLLELAAESNIVDGDVLSLLSDSTGF